jgi:hypothetical protein
MEAFHTPAFRNIPFSGRQDDITLIRFVSGEDGTHHGVMKMMILRSDFYVYVTSWLERAVRQIEDNTQIQNEWERLLAA